MAGICSASIGINYQPDTASYTLTAYPSQLRRVTAAGGTGVQLVPDEVHFELRRNGTRSGIVTDPESEGIRLYIEVVGGEYDGYVGEIFPDVMYRPVDDYADAERIEAYAVKDGSKVAATTVGIYRDGEDALTLDLSNEMQAVPCSADGTPLRTGALATSRVSVYRAADDVTAQWTLAAVATGCTATLDAATAMLTVTAMSADEATVTVTATCAGTTLTADMRLYKVRAGADGQAAVVYSIDSSTDIISRASAGTLTPSAVTLVKMQRVGVGLPQEYTGGGIYLDVVREGIGDAATRIVSPSVTVDVAASDGRIPTALVVSMYTETGVVLDRERIPVVSDGRSGASVEFRYGYTSPTEELSVSFALGGSNTSRHPIGIARDTSTAGLMLNRQFDWSIEPPTGIPEGSKIWMIQAAIDTVADAVIGTWSDPVQFNGDRGDKGEQGDKGDGGISVAVQPTTLFFKEGTRDSQTVIIDIYEGGIRVDNSLITYHNLTEGSDHKLDNTFSWSGYAANGAVNGFMIGGRDIPATRLTVPVAVTYKGVTYNRTFDIRTYRDGKDGSGSSGADGAIIPPPQMWEDYSSEYWFDTGYEGKVDFVYDYENDSPDSRIALYKCVSSHGRDEGLRPRDYCNPDDENNYYWEYCQIANIVATEWLYAKRTRIDDLCAGMVKIVDRNGKVTARMDEDGIDIEGNARFSGHVEATSGRFGNLLVSGNDVLAVDADGNTVARYSIGAMPSVGSSEVRTENRSVTSGGDPNTVVSASGSGVSWRAEGVSAFANRTGGFSHAATFVVRVTAPAGTQAIRLGRVWASYELTGGYSSNTIQLGAITATLAGTTQRIDNAGYGGDIVFAVNGAGVYDIALSVSLSVSGTDFDSTLRLKLDGGVWLTVANGAGRMFVQAADGIMSTASATEYFRHQYGKAIEMRFGNYGFRLSASGIEKMTDGHTWNNM